MTKRFKYRYVTVSQLFLLYTDSMAAKATVLSDDHGIATATHVLGAGFNNGGKLVTKWSVEEVTAWLCDLGFTSAATAFRQHGIDGSMLSKLTENLLKEIGMTVIGQRLLLLNEIVKIQAISRTQWRNTVIWTGEQYRPGRCNNLLPYNFPCHCEPCIPRPDIYKLTNSKVNVLTVQKKCETPCTAWCGFNMFSNNIELTSLKKVDGEGETAVVGDPLSFLKLVENNGTTTYLALPVSQVQSTISLINNAKEEALSAQSIQVMDMLR